MVVRFGRDRSGNFLMMTAILLPVLVGLVGLAADMGLWTYEQQTMQSAADSGAVTAATAYAVNNLDDDELTVEADAVTGSYGFVNGVGGTSITVNRPPKSGPYTTVRNAVEVIIVQPQPRYFSALFNPHPVAVSARAVAVDNGGKGCVLALNPSVSDAISSQGSTNTVLDGCSLFSNSNSSTALTAGGTSSISAFSVGVVGGLTGGSNITASQGITTGDAPVADPYAGASFPPYPGCDYHNYSAKTAVTISPGVYCGGISLNAGADVTMGPGIYYLDQGSLSVNGGATLTGSGVTLVFTSSTGNNYATATINGGATVDLTAPSSGPTAGIVIFGDRNMPVGTTFKFNGGSSQILTGAIYVPTGAVSFAGGGDATNGCTQLVANTISFSGDSAFSLDCPDMVKAFGVTAHLVE